MPYGQEAEPEADFRPVVMQLPSSKLLAALPVALEVEKNPFNRCR